VGQPANICISWPRFVAAIKWLSILACCLVGMGRHELSAAIVPPGFAETVIPGPLGGSWNGAVGITFDATGRMFVWERDGRVWFKDPNDASFTLLLDISEEVGAWWDHGFLGFALDPNFRLNGYIYLLYLVDRHHLLNFGTPSYNPNTDEYFAATIGRLTRYTCRASDNFRSVDPATRFILIGETKQTGIPVCSYTHGVGSLVFGQDGTLLVSCGEGASPEGADPGGPHNASYAPQALADGILRPKEDVGAFRSQLVDCLGGKILRIDPLTGNGVPSNPFYDSANPRAAKSRVWALGLRNPFRMTLRPESGSHNPDDGRPGIVYVGDVGWNVWESLKVVTAPGQNFGWPVYEGLSLTPGYSIAVANSDAPNPLYPASGCNEFFSFIDLLKEDTLNPAGQPPFPNPCDSSQTIPASIPQFLRTRPVLDWHHFSETTRTPTYGPSGEAGWANVGALGSPVSGTPFQGNCSVGGAWYTGTSFPAQYRNLYYHGDWGKGVIKTLALDQNDKPSALGSFVSNAGFIVCIVQHPTNGSLYYVTYNPDSNATSVVQLSYAGNRTPVASASANVYYGPSPLTVQFSSSESSDPDGQPITYSWDFGDGSPISTQANPSHIFSAPAGVPTKFIVTLTVTDSGGLSAQATLIVSANNTPPNVTIISPVDGAPFPPDDATTVDLVATVTDAESSDSQLEYRWQTVLHHNDHDHASPPDTDHVTTTVILPTGCDGINIYYYRIILTVTDPSGLSTAREVRLFPDCGPNTPPTISNIPDQTTLIGTTLGPINFTVGDAETAPANLQLSASSSNPALVPTSNIVFGGSGPDRTITVTPTSVQNGTATITVTVSDGPMTASDSFLVTTTGTPTPANQVTALSFSEGSGTAAADNSGSGHNGTLVNGPTWTAGKFGNGLSLDGTDDYVSVANPSTLNFGTSNFTIALWIKRQATGAEHTIFSKAANTSWTTGGRQLFINGSNNRLTLEGFGVGGVSSTGTITNDGLWHHVAVTFVDSSNTVSFYIDGVASGGGTLNLPADVSTYVVKIGGHPHPHPFRGLIDEFRIFSRALSPSEVQTIMNSAISAP
jgi:PKD repeat protein